MRVDIRVKDRQQVRITKSKITFAIGGLPYNVPGANANVKGDIISIPLSVFTACKLDGLEEEYFDVSEPYKSSYMYDQATEFADFFRKFKVGQQEFYIFGFDKEPIIEVYDKYDAVIASYSEEQSNLIENRLKYEFEPLKGVLSLCHFDYIGDIAKILEDPERLHKAEDYLKSLRAKIKKYLPELDMVWTEKPERTDYVEEFDYWQAQSDYEISAKETFILCVRKNHNRK